MAWLLVVVHWFWHLHGNWYECGAWLARLLPHRFALTPDLRLAILLNLFSVARAVEEFQPVDRWTGEVIQLLDLCSDKLLHAAAWHFSAAFSADFHQSATASERSIALARAASEAPGLGPEFGLVTDRDFVLGNAIWAYAERLVEYGEFAQAIPLLKESLEIFRARESRYEMADGLGTLGRLSLLQGKLAQAHKLLCEAITISTAYNYQEMLGYLQPFIGLVTLYLGDSSEARRLLDESLRLCAELRDKGFLARVCTFLAETALWEEDVAQAAQWLARSLGYDADPQLLTIYGVQRLWVAARLATAQQQHLRAATLFGLADQVHSQVHDAIGGRIRSLADAALATVRAALEPAVFAEAFAAGRQMSLNEPFALSFISLLRAAELSR
jgi:tetratricopeptide (TPR) repeat protein